MAREQPVMHFLYWQIYDQTRELDKMAMKYMGKEKYPLRAPGEVRVIVTIAPDKVFTMG